MKFKKSSGSGGLTRDLACILVLLVGRDVHGVGSADRRLPVMLHLAGEHHVLPVGSDVHQQPACPVKGPILVLCEVRGRFCSGHVSVLQPAQL